MRKPIKNSQVSPKNYLIESILITVFCCLPAGIVGIIYASKVESLYNKSDYEGAKAASLHAKMWVKFGLGLGLFFAICIILIYLWIFASIESSFNASEWSY